MFGIYFEGDLLFVVTSMVSGFIVVRLHLLLQCSYVGLVTGCVFQVFGVVCWMCELKCWVSELEFWVSELVS